jgi:hypothetical protein
VLAAPLPTLSTSREPAALTILNQFIKGFRGQRLNMRSDYVAPDYRKNVNQAKKACIGIPAPTVRDGACGLDGHSHPPLI